MKQFILFYEVRHDGLLSPLIGSDCYLPIDGRFGKERAYERARQHAMELRRNVQKGLVAFQLRRGNIRNNRPDGGIHAVNREVASTVEAASRKGIIKW